MKTFRIETNSETTTVEAARLEVDNHGNLCFYDDAYSLVALHQQGTWRNVAEQTGEQE